MRYEALSYQCCRYWINSPSAAGEPSYLRSHANRHPPSLSIQQQHFPSTYYIDIPLAPPRLLSPLTFSMGRRRSSQVPVHGSVLSKDQSAARRTPLPSASTPSRSKACLLDAILITTEVDYTNGFKTLWQPTDAQTTAHIEVALAEGVSSLVCT